MSMVDFGTFKIDECLKNYSDSQDKSIYKGYYYSDKAPGFSTLLIPIAWVLRHTIYPLPEYPKLLYALRVFGLALPTILFWLLTLPFWEKVSGSKRNAYALIIAGALGTNFLIYATHLFTHVPAAILFFCSYLLIRSLRHAASFWRSFFSGLILSYAFITDFLLFLSALLLAAYALWTLRSNIKGIVGLIFGSFMPMFYLMVMNYLLFDHPLQLAYFYYDDPFVSERYQSQFFNSTFAQILEIARYAFFDAARGLAYVSPFLVLAPIGFLKLWGEREFRMDAILCPLLIIANILMLTKPTTYTGGWATGMRYLVPTLPFLLVGIGGLLRNSDHAVLKKSLFKILAIPSVVMIGIAAATFPDFPDAFSHPITELAMPLFRHGQLGTTIMDAWHPSLGWILHFIIMLAASIILLFFDIYKLNLSVLKYVLIPILLTVLMISTPLFLLHPKLTSSECRMFNKVLHYMGSKQKASAFVKCG